MANIYMWIYLISCWNSLGAHEVYFEANLGIYCSWKLYDVVSAMNEKDTTIHIKFMVAYITLLIWPKDWTLVDSLKYIRT